METHSNLDQTSAWWKEREPLPLAPEVLKRLLQRSKSVCLCVGVAKLFISGYTRSLCCLKEFYLVKSGISFHSAIFAVSWTPQVVLLQRERVRREGRKEEDGVGGKEGCERVRTWKIWQDGRRTETREEEKEGCVNSVLLCCSLSTLESQFHEDFIKP